MTPNDDDRPQLSNEDARFVQRIADALAPPGLTQARGARFDARLAERLSRRRAPRRAAVLVTAMGALALVVLMRLPVERGPKETSAENATAEETLLALTSEQFVDTENDGDEALPDDYQAIASLLY